MAHDKYRSVRLPEELTESIEKEIRSGRKGYKSIAEFIKEAIREKMEPTNSAIDRIVELFDPGETGIGDIIRKEINRLEIERWKSRNPRKRGLLRREDIFKGTQEERIK